MSSDRIARFALVPSWSCPTSHKFFRASNKAIIQRLSNCYHSCMANCESSRAADRTENPGQTLQATALVHEAYLRVVEVDRVQHWENCGHVFATAAEAMRRILLVNARRKIRPLARMLKPQTGGCQNLWLWLFVKSVELSLVSVRNWV